MSAPIFVDLSASAVHLCTTTAAATFTQPNTYCGGIVYGDAIFYARIWQQPTHGYKFWRVKKTGEFCYYQSPDYAPVNNEVGDNCFQISDNVFLLARPFTGAPYEAVIPQYFVNGQTFILPLAFQTSVSPCGVGTLVSTFYCAKQNIVAYEYDQVLGGGGSNVFASIYQNTISGPQLINAGFICDTAFSGYNLFNRISLNYPSGVNSGNGVNAPSTYNGLNFQRGSYFYSISGGAPTVLQFGYNTIKYTGGDTLDCTNTQKNNTYVFGGQNSNLVVSNLSSNPFYPAMISSGTGGSYSEIDGVFLRAAPYFKSNGIADGNCVFIFNNRIVICAKVGTSAQSGIVSAVLFSDGTIVYAVYSPSKLDFYKTSIDLAAFNVYPSATINSKTTLPLVNWTRPISLTGAYKA